MPLSKLCWADKLAHAYDPAWWYLLRARATGELHEYRAEAAAAGHVPVTATDREWYSWLVGHLVNTTRAQDSTPGSYFPKHAEEV
ncbi:MAG: hypothetical protein M0Z41_13860 [Peptococcaceae bacterium]|nr:hypothetical protein [Peptococcaceae bacterium]